MNLEEIQKAFAAELETATTAEKIDEVRVAFLGRSGKLTEVLRSLKDLSLEEKRTLGPKVQELKRMFEMSLDAKAATATSGEGFSKIDLSKPGKKFERGHVHPLTIVDRDIRRIFTQMNFSVVEGPEIETQYYNFDALNIPPDHPARDMWDTFWLCQNGVKGQGSRVKDERKLLRTHTSPVQVRYMESHKPPFQIIVPGRVFRYEATDASHEVNFYQLEGLMVGKDVTFANFKFVVEEFFKRFFGGQKIKFRYRPSYFPFTEPSVEVDIQVANGKWQIANSKEQIVNGKSDKLSAISHKPRWLEVMGGGMVNPRVFEYAHYNPRDLQGFAFGIGIDRLAMIKYNIPDIRLFYSGDLRFIRQF